MQQEQGKRSISTQALLAGRIVLVYIVLGALWILLTDRVLDLLIPDPTLRSYLQTGKGWLYILANALLLYWLIRRGAANLLEAQKAQHQVEESYRQMFERNRAVKLLLDPATGQIVDANPAAADFYGYPLDRLRTMKITDINTLSEAEVQAEMARGKSEEKTYFVFKHRIASGQVRDVEIHSGPIQLGERTLLFSIVHDITSRVRAEEALLRRNRELEALQETTLGIINQLHSDTLLEAIARKAADLLGTQHVFVCLVKENEDGQKYLLMPAGHGFFSIEVGQPLPFGDGLTEQVWRSGETMIIEDYGRWKGRRAALDYMPIHATMAVPLKVGEEVVGVIGCAYFEAGRAISPEEASLFERLGKLASLALQNARLYAALEQELKEREKVEKALLLRVEELNALAEASLGIVNRLDPDSLLETVVVRAANLIGTEHAYLYLKEDGKEGEQPRLKLRVGTGIFSGMGGYSLKKGQGIGGRVWQTGELLAVSNYHEWSGRRNDLDGMGIRAVAGIPLKVGGEVEGVIGVAFFDEGRTVSEEELALLDRFGRLASLALQNARLYTSAQGEIVERARTEQVLQESIATQRQLLAQLLTAQEAERRRLSMEIHDGPLQSLGVALLALDRCTRRVSLGQILEATDELRHLREIIVGIVEEVRSVLAALSLDILNTYGLVAALRDHIAKLSDITGIRANLNSSLPDRLPPYLELLLYRLAQESLANVRKHSQATQVDISLELEGRNLKMIIADNGKGFDVEEALRKEHAGDKIGLHSMRQRIRDALGEMSIISTPGKGTTITFVCPVSEEVLSNPAKAGALRAE